jgi:hypothetical protein
MSYNDGRILEHKVRERQRKALLTLGSIHPDAMAALQMLLNGPNTAIEQEALDAIHC